MATASECSAMVSTLLNNLCQLPLEDLKNLYTEAGREYSARMDTNPVTSLKEWCEKRENASYSFTFLNENQVINCTLIVTCRDHDPIFVNYKTPKTINDGNMAKKDQMTAKKGAAELMMKKLQDLNIPPDKGRITARDETKRQRIEDMKN